MSRKRDDKHKMRKLELYEFIDFNMDEFVDRYLYKITPHEEIYNPSMYSNAVIDTVMTAKRRGSTSRTIIEYKCRYLQDAIIRMSATHEDKVFSLNAEALKKAIGDDYKPLLEVFTEMGYIEKGDGYNGSKHHWYYMVGGYSTLYNLKNTHTKLTKPFYNETIQLYREHAEERIMALREKMYSKLDKGFIKKYHTSLSYIHKEDIEGFNTKINELIAEKPLSEPYYRYLSKELVKKDKLITKIDDSGRIYHILTNMNRELKQYLSIDFTLDCRNSHPLLFNWFIFHNKNISNSSSFNISNLFRDIYINNYININSIYNIYNKKSEGEVLYIYRNVAYNLRKLLNDNNIENESVAKLTDDELLYIFLTTNGLFWEVFCNKHQELSKSEVKESVFKGVFYTNEPRADRFNAFAKEFAEVFPEVFGLIDWWKHSENCDAIQEYMWEHHLYSDKESASLSIAMMGLEAQIFTSILKRLYAKRWNALHIHDCIVIPKDGNKNHPTKEQVKSIMEEVYSQFGLVPTFASDEDSVPLESQPQVPFVINLPMVAEQIVLS